MMQLQFNGLSQNINQRVNSLQGSLNTVRKGKEQGGLMLNKVRLVKT